MRIQKGKEFCFLLAQKRPVTLLATFAVTSAVRQNNNRRPFTIAAGFMRIRLRA
jgi:hypothetical protein